MPPSMQKDSLTSVVVRTIAAWLPFGRTRRAARRRVLHWCRRQGVALVRWREAKLFEGPSSWDAEHRHYRVQVVDAAGRRRSAYVTFARPFVFERCVQVLWDDASGSRVSGSPEPPQTVSDETSGLEPLTSVPR